MPFFKTCARGCTDKLVENRLGIDGLILRQVRSTLCHQVVDEALRIDTELVVDGHPSQAFGWRLPTCDNLTIILRLCFALGPGQSERERLEVAAVAAAAAAVVRSPVASQDREDT